MNGRIPLYLSLLLAVILTIVLLVVQPYSFQADRAQWEGYIEPVRTFLQSAMRRDSAALARQSAGAGPVNWALAAGRRYPDSLAPWADEARIWSGFRRGDTTEVLLTAKTDICGESPIWLRFLERGEERKVLEAGSGCFGEQSASRWRPDR
jgi:hypothetical protein